MIDLWKIHVNAKSSSIEEEKRSEKEKLFTGDATMGLGPAFNRSWGPRRASCLRLGPQMGPKEVKRKAHTCETRTNKRH